MNQPQIDQVKGFLEEFSSIDLSGLIAKSYNNEADLNNIKIGEYSAKEYISVVKKVLIQFSEEIDGVYAKALPYQYHFQNEYGAGNLQQDLANLLSQIKATNFKASIPQINKLIHYQAINGFWEKSKRKYFRSSEVNILEDQKRLDIVTKHMAEVSKQLTAVIEEINFEKEELNRFTNAKKTELSEIESLRTAAKQHSSEIHETYTKSATLEERIGSLLGLAEDKKASITELNDEARKVLSNLNELLQNRSEDSKSQNKTYDKLVKEFLTSLENVESKESYFEERNQYLDDLIEREVGASLFETFKQRKTELISSIGLWKKAVPLTAIATIAWIYFLFGNGDLSSLAWQVIFVNSLKALPAIGLLLFAISQYIKERNFQEEYAFKSAVALTVNSYADQLNENENKDKMIMDSVNQIYKSPLHPKINSKDKNVVTSAAKELIETAKTLVPDKN